MSKLFGIPINQLLVILLVLFGLGVLLMSVMALRQKVIFKMALRNIPRRRAQTVLIVFGLMLATLLFSASFTTGDTLTHSLRMMALNGLGKVDVLVKADMKDAGGGFLGLGGINRPIYFDRSYLEKTRTELKSVPEVDGVAPVIWESAPVFAPSSKQNEPSVTVLGLDEKEMSGFDKLTKADGGVLSLRGLADNQIYLNKEAAHKLGVGLGDNIQIFLGPQPVTRKVAGIYAKGANPSDTLSIVMPLDRLQALTGHTGKINLMIITNRGAALDGGRNSDRILKALKPMLAAGGLKAMSSKRDVLNEADKAGSMFTSIFLMFGQFSIFAGILLIFLIFVMLAAERKKELGIARAVGTQRGHVVELFAFEGAIYALIAAVVGSLLGVLVGWGMVRVMGTAFGQADFQLTFAFNWRSVVIAFTMGMAFTFMIALVSSWRVSRLNIVRAIRDIPEPRLSRKSLKGLIVLILLTLFGVLMTLSGISGKQGGVFMFGTSLIIIGLPLIARRFGLHDRIAFSVAGLGLLAWWLIPNNPIMRILPQMQQGMEMFFISGIMIVIGAVWTVMYNADLLLSAVVRIFGRIRGLPPVLKMAVSYPMRNRFRTGMTLAMFSLVVFTLVTMAVIITSNAKIFEDVDRFSGGFQIRATTSYTNPIPDIRTALKQVKGVKESDFTSVAGLAAAPIKLKQIGTNQKPVDSFIQGVDAAYSEAVTYEFASKAAGYKTDRDVWLALQNEPGTVVVSSEMVKAKVNYNVGMPASPLYLQGVWLEDKKLPEIYLDVRNTFTGKAEKYRVIGVLDQMAMYYAGMVMASQQTLNGLFDGQPVPVLSYMFGVKQESRVEYVSRALEAGFLANGMNTAIMADEIRDGTKSSMMVNNLIQLFMGLGLIVGIVALGVIAARAVVERWKEIGILRAMGFQKNMVQLSFLLESSFVSILGILLGVGLGLALTPQIVNTASQAVKGLTFGIPWLNIILISVVAYLASLLTTFLPARQASKVYPAEALRYE